MAKNLINTQEEGPFGSHILDPKTNKPILEHITPRWIQHFTQRFNIVSRSHTGKLLVSPAKRELIEREVAVHLGKLCRDFNLGELHQDNIFNADETHFVIDQHNHKTLTRRGDQEVKYADVVSGDEGMKMMVLISSGRDASICPPFMIFKNENPSYQICGVPDDIAGVSYRSGPKAWIDSKVFVDWIKEKRPLPALPNGSKRVLFLDNCSGHTLSEKAKEALRKLNTEIRFSPANATDLLQPADSFVYRKLNVPGVKDGVRRDRI